MVKVFCTFVCIGFLMVLSYAQQAGAPAKQAQKTKTVATNAKQSKTAAPAQQQLPVKTYLTMRDSTTSMDVVMMLGKGGSLSLDGRNVKLFNAFFENKPATKTNAPLAGNIMWQINGREYISGSYFLGDSTGYVVFKKDGKEYINQLNGQGNSFFKSQIK